VSAFEELVGRKPTKDQTTWLNDFITHGIEQRRMDDSTAKAHNMPIGSGAIERRGGVVEAVRSLRLEDQAPMCLTHAFARHYKSVWSYQSRLHCRFRADSELEADIISTLWKQQTGT